MTNSAPDMGTNLYLLSLKNIMKEKIKDLTRVDGDKPVKVDAVAAAAVGCGGGSIGEPFCYRLSLEEVKNKSWFD